MNVCLVRFTYFPSKNSLMPKNADLGATAELIGYSEALQESGINVSVFCCSTPTDPIKESKNKIKIFRTIHGFNNSIFFSLKFYYYSFKFLLKANRKNKFDIIHIFSPTLATSLLVLTLRLFTKSIVVFDVRTAPLGKTLRVTIGNLLAKFALSISQGKAILSSKSLEIVSPRLHKLGRVSIIPGGVNLNTFYPKKNNLLREEHSIKKDTLILIYIGTLSIKRDLLTLLEGVISTPRDIVLFLFGRGTGEEYYKKMVKKMDKKNKIFFGGTLPYHKIPEVLNSADCAVSYVPTFQWFDEQMPIKTLEYLACDLPTIATKTKAHLRLFGSYDELFIDTHKKSISDVITYFYDNKKRYDSLDYRSLIESFSWITIARERIIPLYNELLNK